MNTSPNKLPVRLILDIYKILADAMMTYTALVRDEKEIAQGQKSSIEELSKIYTGQIVALVEDKKYYEK